MKDRRKPNGDERRLREMNAELFASSVRQHEQTERAEVAEASLITANAALATDILTLKHAKDLIAAQNRTTLTLLEETLAAKEKLRESEKALAISRDELEDRVIERTAELANANQLLAAESAEREKVQEERLVLLKQILTVQEDERRRIARDMHDHFGQQLTALRLNLDMMQRASGANGLKQKLGETQSIAESLDSDVNFLVWELRPTALDDLGLKAALEHYVRKWSEQFETPAEFHGQGFDNVELPGDVATNLYRIAQEALNNTAKHAEAGNASVIIQKSDSSVIMIVEDDGQGFDSTTQKRSGLGLKGMHERAEMAGGKIEIESALGKGTTIYVTVPLKSEMENVNGK